MSSSLHLAEHGVFISYAHEDHEFVGRLKTWLEEAGFDVWLDKERMRPGESLQKEIYAALRQSRQAIFVLSESWLDSEWGPWELETFHDEHDKNRPKIPILRSRLKQGRIPRIFSGKFHLYWPNGDEEADNAYFWNLYSTLKGENPGDGDRREWARRGREVRRTARMGGGSVLLARTEEDRIKRDVNLTRWGAARAALRCDRDPQWKQIEDHAILPWHEALFVQGADHEAPGLFLETVQQCYPESPDRNIVPVAWDVNRLPQTKAQFFDELARALGCSTESLSQALRDTLSRRSLVLVHRPQLPQNLRSKGLIRYYTHHMPELISQLGSIDGYLKLIQGVSWLASGEAGEAERAETGRWIREIQAHKSLPIIPLKPLTPITPDDVDTWSMTLPPGMDRFAIVREVLAGHPNSSEILSRIIGRYGDLERNP